MGRLSKGFMQQIDIMDIELEDKYGKAKKKWTYIKSQFTFKFIFLMVIY